MKYLLLTIAMFLFGCGYKTSEGYKVGNVTTLQKTGVLINTWETTINIVGNAIPFSVQDKDAEQVLPILREAIENGKRVKVNFTENLYVFKTQGETNRFIRSVVYDSVSK